MSIWIITYHHRHGTDAWLMYKDTCPTEEVTAGLEDWEPNDEYVEVHGVSNDHTQALYSLLKEWVDDEVQRPFFHEEEHGPESLLHRSRTALEELK